MTLTIAVLLSSAYSIARFLSCSMFIFHVLKVLFSIKIISAAYAGFIENVSRDHSYDEVVIMGNTHVDIVPGVVGFDILNSLLSSVNMVACDDLICGPSAHTYVNDALHSASRIDHYFVTDVLKPCINRMLVVDSGVI